MNDHVISVEEYKEYMKLKYFVEGLDSEFNVDWKWNSKLPAQENLDRLYDAVDSRYYLMYV